MKLRVVLFSCVIPLSVAGRTRFIHPSMIVKFLYWAGESSIPDIAKLVIKKSYDISLPGTYLVDYGCEAVYAGFTRGPEKIPHELIKYACALKIASHINTGIDHLNVHYPRAIQNSRYLNTLLGMIRPFLVRCFMRIGIDLFADAYLEEPDQDEEPDSVEYTKAE